MNSSFPHDCLVVESGKTAPLQRIADGIASQNWFRPTEPDRAWLDDYLARLCALGIVGEDDLAVCAMAAAKHRYKVSEAEHPSSSDGIYLPDEVALLRAIVTLVRQEERDSEKTGRLAQRTLRLYRAGYHDPEALLRMMDTIG